MFHFCIFQTSKKNGCSGCTFLTKMNLLFQCFNSVFFRLQKNVDAADALFWNKVTSSFYCCISASLRLSIFTEQSDRKQFWNHFFYYFFGAKKIQCSFFSVFTEAYTHVFSVTPVKESTLIIKITENLKFFFFLKALSLTNGDKLVVFTQYLNWNSFCKVTNC